MVMIILCSQKCFIDEIFPCIYKFKPLIKVIAIRLLKFGLSYFWFIENSESAHPEVLVAIVFQQNENFPEAISPSRLDSLFYHSSGSC